MDFDIQQTSSDLQQGEEPDEETLRQGEKNPSEVSYRSPGLKRAWSSS